MPSANPTVPHVGDAQAGLTFWWNARFQYTLRKRYRKERTRCLPSSIAVVRIIQMAGLTPKFLNNFVH